jgi:sugar lactone lactonase YvrE
MRSTEARVFIEPASEEDRYLPEGPRILPYSDGDQLGPAAWVNIQAGPDSKHGTLFVRGFSGPNAVFRQQELPGRTGFVLPTHEVLGVLIGCEKKLKVRAMVIGSWRTLATIPDDNPRTIINDGEIVPGGKAIVFGTKDVQFKEPIANLYLYTVDDNRVSLLADGQTCSNGKVFASDARGLILYDIDTPKRNVVRYRLDVAARTAAPDGVALDLSGEIGFPDGMCDCGDGTVIIAFYNPDFAAAGRATRFDLASGRAVEEWTTPGSPRVTCPLLVRRPDGVKLILTTATEGMPAEMRARCPNAGCLFIADTQLSTCPEPEVVRIGS